jgi:murein L,D-transpeptidase YcbB/YkuD
MPKKVHPIAEAASAYTGYTSRDVNNTFAISSGYTGGFQWDGAFIDRVLKDAGAASVLPRHVNTATALAFYIKNGYLRSKPLAGDLVFYNFPTASQTVSFDPGHIGVVTDASKWKTAHAFRAVEAQVASGLPKAASEENGVYERTRFATDVATFVRIPRYLLARTTDTKAEAAAPTLNIRTAHFERCAPGKAQTAKPEFRKSVEIAQLALAAHPGVRLQNADRGVYDRQTRAALAAFQRLQGFPPSECTGQANVKTLEALGKMFDSFHVID